MLNFDEARFLRIQSGAVGLADGLSEAVTARLAAGARNVFFLGSGGAGILMYPAASLLQARSRFGAFTDWAAQIVQTGSAHLGPDSMVVIPSLSGSTAESLAVLEYAKQAGATVISAYRQAGLPAGRQGRLQLQQRGGRRHLERILLSPVAHHRPGDHAAAR